MLLRERIALYCANHMKHKIIFCGQNAQFQYVKASGTCEYMASGLYKLNINNNIIRSSSQSLIKCSRGSRKHCMSISCLSILTTFASHCIIQIFIFLSLVGDLYNPLSSCVCKILFTSYLFPDSCMFLRTLFPATCNLHTSLD
jgi:hypothetical protein